MLLHVVMGFSELCLHGSVTESDKEPLSAACTTVVSCVSSMRHSFANFP